MTPAEAYAAGRKRGLSKMEMQENLRGNLAACLAHGSNWPGYIEQERRIKSFLDYLDGGPDEAAASAWVAA